MENTTQESKIELTSRSWFPFWLHLKVKAKVYEKEAIRWTKQRDFMTGLYGAAVTATVGGLWFNLFWYSTNPEASLLSKSWTRFVNRFELPLSILAVVTLGTWFFVDMSVDDSKNPYHKISVEYRQLARDVKRTIQRRPQDIHAYDGLRNAENALKSKAPLKDITGWTYHWIESDILRRKLMKIDPTNPEYRSTESSENTQRLKEFVFDNPLRALSERHLRNDQWKAKLEEMPLDKVFPA